VNGKLLSVEVFKTPYAVKDLRITPWFILHIITFSRPNKACVNLIVSLFISIHHPRVEWDPLSIDTRCEVQVTDLTSRPKCELSGASEIPEKYGI